MKTLEQILNYEKAHRVEDGDFGIKACKECIKKDIEIHKKWNMEYNTKKYVTSLYSFLEEYVKRANEDIFFNNRMVLACWELINGIE